MIVGTAGHIDHGKTALVKALTGVDTDRLAEEKARGISIELGFAYLPCPDGSVVGFVDVPGHERFMRTMLAGATGVDFALLVIAADDGIRPQTREHLAALDLIGVKRGIVALSKSDLVDASRLREIGEAVSRLLQDTTLDGAPIAPVSARNGEGVEALRGALIEAAQTFLSEGGSGRFRMNVDRSFSLPGVGAVVTGAIAAGRVALGDTVKISPSGQSARVRGLHAQNRAATYAGPGERCGVNLAGIDAKSIQRGDVLVDPALHAPAARIDVELRLLASESRALAHWTPVRLHHGAADTGARIALLQDEAIAPGASGRAQLVLDEAIAAAIGDRFVLRDASASRTMGGGRFLDLRAPARRRRTPGRRAQLDAMAIEDPILGLAAQMRAWPHCMEWPTFARDRAMGREEEARVLTAVPHEAAGAFLFDPDIWAKFAGQAAAETARFHEAHPHLLGLGAQRILAALEPRLAKAAGQAFIAELVRRGALASEGGMLRAPTHRLALDRDDLRLWKDIRPLLEGAARYRPPRMSEVADALGRREFDVRRVMKSLARQGKLTEVAPDLFFLRDTMREVCDVLARLAEAGEAGAFSAAALRDALDNGRKVAIQLLEHFDRQGVTIRRGDVRVIDRRKLERYRSAADSNGRESFPVERPDFKSG